MEDSHASFWTKSSSLTIVIMKVSIQNLAELGKRRNHFRSFKLSEKNATNGMTILPQMCENGHLLARTLLLMKQYITFSTMLSFSSIHAVPMVIEVLLSSLKCKLFFNVTCYVWFVDEWNRSFHSWHFRLNGRSVQWWSIRR